MHCHLQDCRTASQPTLRRCRWFSERRPRPGGSVGPARLAAATCDAHPRAGGTSSSYSSALANAPSTALRARWTLRVPSGPRIASLLEPRDQLALIGQCDREERDPVVRNRARQHITRQGRGEITIGGCRFDEQIEGCFGRAFDRALDSPGKIRHFVAHEQHVFDRSAVDVRRE